MPSVTLIRYFYPNAWHWPLGSHEVTIQRIAPAIFKIMDTNILVLRSWPYKVTWHHLSRDQSIRHNAISYWCPIGNESLYSTVFEIFAAKYIWVTTLTFQRRATSSVMPCDHLILRVQFPVGALCERVSISSHFRDNGPQTYWGHDLDLF